MKTFEKFTREIYESDIILSEARSVLVEKDSDAVKQYKKSEKSFKKGFGKNIKPTVVQPGLDLYKAGGPYVPDKTTFKDTGKKVPKMEPKPQFGTEKPSTKSGAPDRTLVKKAISDVKDSERRLFQKGLGKGTAGIRGVKGKKGISLARQRGYTREIIRDLSAKTTQSDARMRGSSTEGTAGASGSSKTTKPKVTPTKGVNQADVSKQAKDFTTKVNAEKKVKDAIVTKSSKSSTKSKSDVNRIAQNKIDTEKAAQFKKTDEYKSIAQGKDSQGNYLTPQQRKKNFKNFQSDVQKVNKKVTQGAAPDYNPPGYGTPSYYKRQGKDAFDLKKNPIGGTGKREPKLPKFVRDKNLSFRNRSNAITRGGKTVSKSGGSSYKKTIVPELQKRGFKGAAGKRAAIGKGAKLVKAAAKKSPLGALALGAAGLVGAYVAGKSVFGGKPKDTLTKKDFTKLNKMPNNSPKGIVYKDGSEVRRDFFMTKKQKENKIKQGKDIISTNRKERDKNFTKKLRSGEYFTPGKKS